jgi:hypothetical protein
MDKIRELSMTYVEDTRVGQSDRPLDLDVKSVVDTYLEIPPNANASFNRLTCHSESLGHSFLKTSCLEVYFAVM